jgi:uncharacterized repeat protein (TIGR04138 family)
MAGQQSSSLLNKITQISEKDSRFDVEAYLFLFEALAFAQAKFAKKKHVNGKELLEGIKELALERYGPMSMTVFEHWGINTTDDFGEIVFVLVENGLLRKTTQDNREDFHDVYSFDEVFVKEYRYGSKV